MVLASEGAAACALEATRQSRSSKVTEFRSVARRFLREQSAATMVEYGIMLACIAAVCFVAIDVLGGETNTLYNELETIMP